MAAALIFCYTIKTCPQSLQQELESGIEHIDIDAVKEALENGANANSTTWNEKTWSYRPALIAAIEKNSPEIVQALLDHGADPNVVIGDCVTALMITHNPKIRRALLSSGGRDSNPFLSQLLRSTNMLMYCIDKVYSGIFCATYKYSKKALSIWSKDHRTIHQNDAGPFLLRMASNAALTWWFFNKFIK
jgi:hypothetical protein